MYMSPTIHWTHAEGVELPLPMTVVVGEDLVAGLNEVTRTPPSFTWSL